MPVIRDYAKCMASTLAVAVLATASVDAKQPTQATPAASAQAEHVAERLGVPGPIVFGAEEYRLAWSSAPDSGLYKQEYLQVGESVDAFTSMIMIDLRPDGANAIQMAQGIAAQIAARKGNDPVANYDVIVNPDTNEAIIDFLISAQGADGKDIVEWSAYRFATRPDGTGTVLLGIARRGYSDSTIDFLKSLKTVRQRDIGLLSALKIEIVDPTQP